VHDGRTHALLTPWTYRLADAIVTVSDGLRWQVMQTWGVDERKVRVIHNPIDIATVQRSADVAPAHRWLGVEHELAVAAGRLTAQKDYPTLLRAFTKVHRERPNARLLLNELQAQITSLGLVDTVELTGLCANPFAFFARARCFVLSSRFEGFGMVIVEAMAAGAPVVSTDCPYGPADILADGQWGLLVPVGNSDALADAMIRLLTDSSLRAQLAAAGQARALDFDTSVIAPQLESLVADLAGHIGARDLPGYETQAGSTHSD
jgi:glycosyltransferase involved in cell wall biosynthesis